MLIKTTIAISIAMMVGAISPGLSKDQKARRDQSGAALQQSDRFHSFGQSALFGQAGVGRQGKCWVPTRDDSDEYGADTRGLGYWGSCNEKGAVPTK